MGFGATAQGLQFTGGHEPIDQRSSLELFFYKAVSFDNYFEIGFDLESLGTTSMGYILRIKSKEDGKIFNLHYEEEEGNAVFRLNEEGKRSLITAKVAQETLQDMNWFPVKIRFDLQKKTISLTINKQVYTVDDIKLPGRYTPLIFFGKSEHLIDVPPIAIRNLVVGNDEERLKFPLREHAGEMVHDENGEVFGRVDNPKWLINESYHWKRLSSYVSASEAGADYSERRNEIYYFNRGSITIYNLRSGESKSFPFSSPCPVRLILGNSFVDDQDGKLYVYETYYNGIYEGPTVASLDLETYTWKTESYERPNSELHHHSYFFDPARKTFTIFGGYGNMRYSNQFMVYNLKDAKWTLEDGYQGKAIIPRYFSSAGLSADKSQAYLFGGMGNEAGKHIVGRKYFYDLHVIDLNKKQLKKRWEVKWKEDNIVPARGIVVPDTSYMYLLGYPEHLTNSYIKLYRFALKNGEHKILGDSIPIYSDRISTRAKLFHDKNLNRLLAVVQESKDDVSSKLSLYVLNFPPISAAELTYSSKKKSQSKLIYFAFLAVVTITGLGYWTYHRRNYRPSTEPDTATQAPLPEPMASTRKKNSIFLFGDFTVLDRDGRDITHLFSARLKQTFCLLLSHIDSGGISSKLLSHTLWPDKPYEKVKTSRGVTLNNLRKVLAELDGVEVLFEKGNFHLVISEKCFCDYIECLNLMKQGNTADNQELLSIISRGKFLLGEDNPMFDSMKVDMESKLIPILLGELQNYHQKNQHLKTIRIADLLFELDPINEEALAYSINAIMALKLETKAKNSYQAFSTEYQRMMGEDYPYSFDELRKKIY